MNNLIVRTLEADLRQELEQAIKSGIFRANFLVAGTAKGGTTALAKFLSVHPDVFVPSKKEVRYFSNDRFFRDTPDYAQYHQAFLEENDNFFHASRQFVQDFDSRRPEASMLGVKRSLKAVGEASPLYMWWNDAPQRIHAYNRAMKFIFVLRNPIERAFSHHLMLRKRGEERLPFLLAMLAEPVRTFRKGRQLKGKAYLGRSLYCPQILRMLEYFPREQMLFIKNEDLMDRHRDTLDRVWQFLDVPPMEVPQEIVHARVYSPLPVFVRRWLWRKCEPDVRQLEQLLGWDCSSWRDFALAKAKGKAADVGRCSTGTRC